MIKVVPATYPLPTSMLAKEVVLAPRRLGYNSSSFSLGYKYC